MLDKNSKYPPEYNLIVAFDGLLLLHTLCFPVDLESFERFLGTPKNMRLFVHGYVGFAMAENLFRSLSHDSVGFHGADIWMDKKLVQPVSLLEQDLFYAGINLYLAC